MLHEKKVKEFFVGTLLLEERKARDFNEGNEKAKFVVYSWELCQKIWLVFREKKEGLKADK